MISWEHSISGSSKQANEFSHSAGPTPARAPCSTPAHKACKAGAWGQPPGRAHQLAELVVSFEAPQQPAELVVVAVVRQPRLHAGGTQSLLLILGNSKSSRHVMLWLLWCANPIYRQVALKGGRLQKAGTLPSSAPPYRHPRVQWEGSLPGPFCSPKCKSAHALHELVPDCGGKAHLRAQDVSRAVDQPAQEVGALRLGRKERPPH